MPRRVSSASNTFAVCDAPVSYEPVSEADGEPDVHELFDADTCEDASGPPNPFNAALVPAASPAASFEDLYDRISATAADRYRIALSALDEYGLGDPPDRALFEERLHDVVGVLKLEGRKEDLQSILELLGQRPGAAATMADRLWAGEDTMPPPSVVGPGVYLPTSMRNIDDLLFRSGQDVRGRFEARLSELTAPYSGDSDQLFDLLSEFPDLSDSAMSEPWVQEAAASYQSKQELYGYLKMGGLIAAGILLTVATGGALGPEAATMVGVGYAGATGGYQVSNAAGALRNADDAYAAGLASKETVAARENDLIGAVGALGVNVLSAGLFAKVSGIGSCTLLGGGSGALSTALNPNVWDSDDSAELLLKGAIVGGAGGAIGAIGGRTGNVALGMMRSAASPQLSVGSRVDVAFEGGAAPEQWRVAHVDEQSGRMVIERDSRTLTLSITSAQIVRTDGEAPSIIAMRASDRASFAKAGFDRASAEHQAALLLGDHVKEQLDRALVAGDVARAQRGVSELEHAEATARAAGTEMLDRASALGPSALAAAEKSVAEGEARLADGRAMKAEVARASGTARDVRLYFSDADARRLQFEELYLSDGPGRSRTDARALFELAGGVRIDSQKFFEGDEIAPMVERLAEKNTPTFVIRGAPRNLAGINGQTNGQGGHTTGDNFYAGMSRVVEEELKKIGCDVYAYRLGAKATFIVTGGAPTEEAVGAALARAEERIDTLVREAGYEDLQHPKHQNEPAWRGVGMTFATEQLRPTDAYAKLDAGLDAETARYNREELGMMPGPDVEVELTPVAPPGGTPAKRATVFLDPIAYRRQEFIGKAGELGVPAGEATRLFENAGGARLDPDTGYLFGEDRLPTLERAIAFSEQPGQRAYYVEMDIRNLGAVNSALGRDGAIAEFRVGADLIAEELGRIDAGVSLFHHGGDEISAVIVGRDLDPSAINDALVRAQTRYREYMTARGLGVLEHPKYRGDSSKNGIGFSFAIEEARPGDSAKAVAATADKLLEEIKKR